MTGPLDGLQVIELGSIGPGPHAAMVLADLGADIVRVDWPSTGEELSGPPETDLFRRNRSSVELDLKSPNDQQLLLDLVDRADVLLEGFRPGVTERLGVGPNDCLARNPRLVYARMTGWGQHGPRSLDVGHDINYIALTGILDAIGRPDERPVPPLNLIGDFGGGSMLVLVGILAAMWERQASGLGQVVDAAMVDGASILGQILWSLDGQGRWGPDRGCNLLDGGAPFYDTYTCADGRHVAVGAIEPLFYEALLVGLGLNGERNLPGQHDKQRWPELRARIADRFAERDRDAWRDVFAESVACVTPVLTRAEAAEDEHLRARETIIEVAGVRQAAPAPRFSRTPTAPPSAPGTTTTVEAVLAAWTR